MFGSVPPGIEELTPPYVSPLKLREGRELFYPIDKGRDKC